MQKLIIGLLIWIQHLSIYTRWRWRWYAQEISTSWNGHVHKNDDEELNDFVEREWIELERKEKLLDEYLMKNPTKDDMIVFERMNK